MEINRIGNKNCWIKNWSQHWWFFNRGGLLILGDHLFLNYIFFLVRGGWLIPRGLLILTWHYRCWLPPCYSNFTTLKITWNNTVEWKLYSSNANLPGSSCCITYSKVNGYNSGYHFIFMGWLSDQNWYFGFKSCNFFPRIYPVSKHLLVPEAFAATLTHG